MYHKTKDGKKTPLKEMGMNHLINTIEYLLRQKVYTTPTDNYIMELKRRIFEDNNTELFYKCLFLIEKSNFCKETKECIDPFDNYLDGVYQDLIHEDFGCRD
jgi:hypothetical protein